MAASFLPFLFVISRKNSKLFCYSIKRAHFNKPWLLFFIFIERWWWSVKEYIDYLLVDWLLVSKWWNRQRIRERAAGEYMSYREKISMLLDRFAENSWRNCIIWWYITILKAELDDSAFNFKIYNQYHFALILHLQWILI